MSESEKPSNSEAVAIFKDWRTWRDQGLDSGKVSAVIGKWPDPRSSTLQIILKEFLNQPIKFANPYIDQLFRSFLPSLIEDVIELPGLKFYDFVVIKSAGVAAVFSAKMKMDDQLEPKDVIVKAFPRFLRNFNERHENRISQSLADKSFMVPQRFLNFSTEHYNCYPMEKIDSTLADLLGLPIYKNGVGLKLVCSLIRTIVPILKSLHSDKWLYVDFSISNVAISLPDLIPYMIDFGGVHLSVLKFPPLQKTLRYCSPDNYAGRLISNRDDFIGFGFVLLDAYIGVEESPLGVADSDVLREQIIKDCCSSKYGDLLREFFSLVNTSSTPQVDIYDQLLKLAE